MTTYGTHHRHAVSARGGGVRKVATNGPPPLRYLHRPRLHWADVVLWACVAICVGVLAKLAPWIALALGVPLGIDLVWMGLSLPPRECPDCGEQWPCRCMGGE